MRVGMIGLGKLGFPCALAMADCDHEVYGYDNNYGLMENLKAGKIDYYEPGIIDYYNEVREGFHFCDSMADLVRQSEIIFIAVQTPHPPELDGSIRFNHVRKDFDYAYLRDCAKEVALRIKDCGFEERKVVVVVSTVLPGTTRREVYPIMRDIIGEDTGKNWGLCYNPFFIAMGTSVRDFLKPEFTLIGCREPLLPQEEADGNYLADFFDSVQDSPKLVMTWESAEITKVLYNTYITSKICIANMIMEMCHKIPEADCGDVQSSLMQATDRVVSPAYMRGGMGDGGSCHPRDNLALASLSDRLKMSYNWFDYMMTVREQQTEWLIGLIKDARKELSRDDTPVVILGKTFKPDTDLTYGSPSILTANIMADDHWIKPVFFDPVIQPDLSVIPAEPCVYLVGTNWSSFVDFPFYRGSIVIDPWRYIPDVEGVKVVRIGERESDS